MITNHHIAIQFATERQRDLRASSGGWNLSDLFSRWFRRPLPGRVAGDQIPARGAEVAPAILPTVGGTSPAPRHLRRSRAASGARHIAARRNRSSARGRERTPS